MCKCECECAKNKERDQAFREVEASMISKTPFYAAQKEKAVVETRQYLTTILADLDSFMYQHGTLDDEIGTLLDYYADGTTIKNRRVKAQAEYLGWLMGELHDGIGRLLAETDR